MNETSELIPQYLMKSQQNQNRIEYKIIKHV